MGFQKGGSRRRAALSLQTPRPRQVVSGCCTAKQHPRLLVALPLARDPDYPFVERRPFRRPHRSNHTPGLRYQQMALEARPYHETRVRRSPATCEPSIPFFPDSSIPQPRSGAGVKAPFHGGTEFALLTRWDNAEEVCHITNDRPAGGKGRAVGWDSPGIPHPGFFYFDSVCPYRELRYHPA